MLQNINPDTTITMLLLFLDSKAIRNRIYAIIIGNRVGSESDDPDNLCHLGHFFGGSSGSHL